MIAFVLHLAPQYSYFLFSRGWHSLTGCCRRNEEIFHRVPRIYSRVENYVRKASAHRMATLTVEWFSELCTFLEFIELSMEAERGGARMAVEKTRPAILSAKDDRRKTPIINHTPAYLDFAAQLHERDIVISELGWAT